MKKNVMILVKKKQNAITIIKRVRRGGGTITIVVIVPCMCSHVQCYHGL